MGLNYLLIIAPGHTFTPCRAMPALLTADWGCLPGSAAVKCWGCIPVHSWLWLHDASEGVLHCKPARLKLCCPPAPPSLCLPRLATWVAEELLLPAHRGAVGRACPPICWHRRGEGQLHREQVVYEQTRLFCCLPFCTAGGWGEIKKRCRLCQGKRQTCLPIKEMFFLFSSPVQVNQ